MITTEYNLKGPANLTQSNPLTIAVVADLHEHNPDPVLQILEAVNPDIICVPGDLFENYIHSKNLDKYDHNLFYRIVCFIVNFVDKLAEMHRQEKRNVKKENSYRFLREANAIAPVYYSLGNHELYLTDEDKEVLVETGTVLLNNEYVEFRPGVFIGGIPSKQCTGRIDVDFLQKLGKNDGYKILLCHHPEYFEKVASSADLIISGHCHGGQIRIKGRHGRLDRGVFTPGLGLFPHYHHGVYCSSEDRETGGTGGMKEHQMVVSSGCANTASIPRWGNPEEIVVVRISGN